MALDWHPVIKLSTKKGDCKHRARWLNRQSNWHVNPEVFGSTPALVNFCLFNLKSFKTYPVSFPVYYFVITIVRLNQHCSDNKTNYDPTLPLRLNVLEPFSPHPALPHSSISSFQLNWFLNICKSFHMSRVLHVLIHRQKQAKIALN